MWPTCFKCCIPSQRKIQPKINLENRILSPKSEYTDRTIPVTPLIREFKRSSIGDQILTENVSNSPFQPTPGSHMDISPGNFQKKIDNSGSDLIEMYKSNITFKGKSSRTLSDEIIIPENLIEQTPEIKLYSQLSEIVIENQNLIKEESYLKDPKDMDSMTIKEENGDNFMVDPLIGI